MATGQIRISLLNPGADISPLRLRGWLQNEAAQISARCEPGDGAIVRLFLTRKLRFGFTQQKLDTLLQTIADKTPGIVRIETLVVEAPLTPDQMQEEIRIADADLDNYLRRAGGA